MSSLENQKINSTSTMHCITGIKFSTGNAGIKKVRQKHDIALLSFPAGSVCSGVFTTSRTCAYNIELDRESISKAQEPRGLVIISGNANAATGQYEKEAAEKVRNALAKKLDCTPEQIYIAFTGVIGEILKYESPVKFIDGALFSDVLASDWLNITKAMMTTDVFPKCASEKLMINENEILISGICKGAGMVAPNMATVLVYIFTNVNIDQQILQEINREVANETLNRVSVEGDTSTSDIFQIFSTCSAKNEKISSISSPEAQKLKAALTSCCYKLSRLILLDGEGASKFVKVSVSGAPSNDIAKLVVESICNSILVKTSWAASSINWGRVYMAIGKSPYLELKKSDIDITICGISLYKQGEPQTKNDFEFRKRMKEKDITIDVKVGNGNGSHYAFTTDLSIDYVKFNADYVFSGT